MFFFKLILISWRFAPNLIKMHNNPGRLALAYLRINTPYKAVYEKNTLSIIETNSLELLSFKDTYKRFAMIPFMKSEFIYNWKCQF
jgi:hypothetical protein